MAAGTVSILAGSLIGASGGFGALLGMVYSQSAQTRRERGQEDRQAQREIDREVREHKRKAYLEMTQLLHEVSALLSKIEWQLHTIAGAQDRYAAVLGLKDYIQAYARAIDELSARAATFGSRDLRQWLSKPLLSGFVTASTTGGPTGVSTFTISVQTAVAGVLNQRHQTIALDDVTETALKQRAGLLAVYRTIVSWALNQMRWELSVDPDQPEPPPYAVPPTPR